MNGKQASRTIERAIASRPGVVDEYWHEDEPSQWWVVMKRHYRDNPSEHSFNGTAADIARCIREAKPCHCRECEAK